MLLLRGLVMLKSTLISYMFLDGVIIVPYDNKLEH